MGGDLKCANSQPSDVLTVAAERTLFPPDQPAAELAQWAFMPAPWVQTVLALMTLVRGKKLPKVGALGKTRSEWPQPSRHRWAYPIDLFVFRFFRLLKF